MIEEGEITSEGGEITKDDAVEPPNKRFRVSIKEVQTLARLKKNNSPEDFIKHLCYNCKQRRRERAKDRMNEDFVHHCIELYHKQKGLCALTGVKMQWTEEYTLDRNFSPMLISIDRIDCKKSYEIGNVRLVCQYINHAIGCHGDNLFYFFVEHAYKNLENKKRSGLRNLKRSLSPLTLYLIMETSSYSKKRKSYYVAPLPNNPKRLNMDTPSPEKENGLFETYSTSSGLLEKREMVAKSLGVEPEKIPFNLFTGFIYAIETGKDSIDEPVSDRTRKYVFNDAEELVKRKSVRKQDIVDFVLGTVNYILDGGKGYYLTLGYHNEKEKTDDQDHLEFSYTRIPNEKEFSSIEFQLDDGKRISLYSVIREYRHKITRRNAFFEPIPWDLVIIPVPLEKSSINLFTGFKARHIEDANDFSDIKPILDHILIIWCTNKRDAFEYIMNYFAHICQKPWIKTSILILLKSAQEGAGKTFLLNFFGKKVLGKRYYYLSNDLRDITGKFNALLESKIFTVIDEAPSNRKYNSDKMKNMISEEDQKIEKKGIDASPATDYNNYFVTTNNPRALEVSATDRRHFCLEVSNDRVGDTNYFNNLANLCDNPRISDLFYTFLLKRDISSWNKDKIPMTELKRDLKMANISSTIRYMIYLVTPNESGECPFPFDCKEERKVFHDTLYHGYNKWIHDRKERSVSIQEFKTDLKGISLDASINSDSRGRIYIGNERKQGYVVPSFDQLRENIRTWLRDPGLEFD